MRLVISAVLMCAVRLPAPSVAAAQDSAPLFRHITLAPHGTITLGTMLDRPDITVQLSDSSWTLKAGVFGGAEAIVVYVLPDRRVYALEFLYAPETSYERLVSIYRKRLGAPSGAGGRGDGPDLTTWQDSTTRFAVSRRRLGPVDRVVSRMTDLTLVAP